MVGPSSRPASARLLILMSLLALGVLAAVWNWASAPAEARPGTATSGASAYLSQNASEMGLLADLGDLQAVRGRTSLTAEHVQYQQTINGVPVFGATVSVSLPKQGDATAWVLNRYASGATAAKLAAPVAPGKALANAASSIGAASAQETAPAELVYYPAGGKTFRLAWKLMLRTEEPFGSWLVIADAETGEHLLRLSLLRYDEGRVFDPNPAATNGGTAAVPDCDGPAKAGVLSPQYRTRTLLGIDSGQGQLKGAFVDMTAPGIVFGYKPAGVADEASHNYIYHCVDDRFEEVMTYYHLDTTQRKIRSLGFTGATGIVERPIPAHAHYSADCNAFYDPGDRGVHFGDFDDLLCGGPTSDAGEDADVIVHEYGHAIQDDQVPGWGQTMPPLLDQPGAIGEGFGDFIAGVMNGDPCIGEYVNFGLSECDGSPGLRWMQNDMTYPAGFASCPNMDYDGDGNEESEEVHCGGLLWGGALWDLTEELSGGASAVTQAGRDLALRLVLESQFYLDQEARFDEAAAAVCFADGLLYDGAHQGAIGSVFAGRGIDSGACTPTDFPSIYARIRHVYSGDLDVNILVGADKNAPLCEVNLRDPNPFLFFPDIYGFQMLDDTSCGSFMPPTTGQPFWLEVQDTEVEYTGVIEDFQALLPGGIRCIAEDTPIDIPDNGPFVYSKVDCTKTLGPGGGTPGPETPTPTLPPGGDDGLAGDVDCSTLVNSVDSLKILRYVALLSVAQTEPCVDVGGAAGVAYVQGDVDCNGAASSVDSLKILRFVAGMTNNLPAGCPAIGSAISGGPTPTATPSPTAEPGTPTPTFDPSLTDCSGFGLGWMIPDNDPSGFVGTIEIPESGSLVDIDVCVNVDHPRPNDLRLTLTHVASGTSVLLFNGTACAMPDVRLYFNDEGAHGTICPLDGEVRPWQTLNAFDGLEINGTWELTFADVQAGQEGAALGVTVYYEYLN